MNDRLTKMLAPLVGMEIPGGCDHCDAYQTVDEDRELPGVWHMRVHHDDWCPFLREYERRHTS